MENNEPNIEQKKERKPLCWRKVVWQLVFVALIGGSGYVLWRYPNTLTEAKRYLMTNQEQEQKMLMLQDELLQVQEELVALRRSVNMNSSNATAAVDLAVESLKGRFEAVEKMNANVIDSKADVAMLLGLITRMDKAEERLDGLAKVSDDAALMLSTTMLIKEKALKGQPFAFEAEVLQLLGEGKVKVKDEVAFISEVSVEGAATDFELINGFNQIYHQIMIQAEAQEEPLTWKDRVKQKFREFLQMRSKAPDVEIDNDLALAQKYVNSGNFYKAVEVLESKGQAEFADWIALAKRRIELDKAFSKISTHSLALMQVNHLKARTNAKY